MNEPAEDHDPLGWWVLRGTYLIENLRRVAAGEDADVVFAEMWANTRKEDAA